MSEKLPDDKMEGDQDSPECLLTSEPVKDPYSTEEEIETRAKEPKHRKPPLDKFITCRTINASDILPWEMEYYLLAEYELVEPTQTLNQKPSIAQLVEESLIFLFPNGVPESQKNKSSSQTDWKFIVPQIIEDFFEKPKNKWFKEMYQTDYSQDPNIFTDNESETENVKLRSKWSEHRQSDDRKCAAQLISIMHNVLSYMLKDELQNTAPQGSKAEKQNKVKWMMNEIMRFLYIPVLYNGDCNLDFEYKYEIPERKLHGLEYTIRPDLTLYTETWPQLTRLPYCCIEVYGPCASKLPERISRASDWSSLEKSGIDDKMKELHLIDKEPASTKSNVTVTKARSDDMNVKKPSLSFGYSAANVHLDATYHTEVNSRIMANTPFKLFRTSDEVLRKLSAELGMEMFGLLVQKAKLGNFLESFVKQFKEKRVISCMGMFVMNHRIYLSQITHSSFEMEKIMKEDSFLNKHKIGPKFCYANWFFNLKHPNDRLALLVFLNYYHSLMENENPVVPTK